MQQGPPKPAGLCLFAPPSTHLAGQSSTVLESPWVLTLAMAPACRTLVAVELALNLCWLMLSCLLCACCVWAHRRGAVRLPLRLALGCSLLLAVLLFPAISMTDDLQRSNTEMEVRVRMHSAADLGSCSTIVEMLPVLLLALLFLGAIARTRLLWLTAPRERRIQTMAFRAAAMRVRPPTLGRAVLA